MIDGQTHTQTQRQTQAITTSKGQNWPRVKISRYCICIFVCLIAQEDGHRLHRQNITKSGHPRKSLWSMSQTKTLIHWGQVMHICVSKLRHHWLRQWLLACLAPNHYFDQCWLVVISPSRTYLNEILLDIQSFIFKKMHLKMLCAKWQPSCPGLKMLASIRDRMMWMKINEDRQTLCSVNKIWAAICPVKQQLRHIEENCQFWKKKWQINIKCILYTNICYHFYRD